MPLECSMFRQADSCPTALYGRCPECARHHVLCTVLLTDSNGRWCRHLLDSTISYAPARRGEGSGDVSAYTATQGPEGAWWWFVKDSTGAELCPPPLTTGEAHIIAWALNVVASGGRLAYMSDHKNVGEQGACGFYDGPTGGVAPPPAEVRS